MKVYIAQCTDWDTTPPECIEQIGVFFTLEGAVKAMGIYDERYLEEKGRTYVSAPYEREDGVYIVFPEGEPPADEDLSNLWITECEVRP